MEFPRLVYRSASDHIAVDTAEQYDSAIADGWYASVPEALAKKHNAVIEQAPQSSTYDAEYQELLKEEASAKAEKQRIADEQEEKQKAAIDAASKAANSTLTVPKKK